MIIFFFADRTYKATVDGKFSFLLQPFMHIRFERNISNHGIFDLTLLRYIEGSMIYLRFIYWAIQNLK